MKPDWWVDIPLLTVGIGLAVWMSWRIKRTTGSWPWN